jgi:hypothetical protein
VAVRHLAEVSLLAEDYLGPREGVEHVSAAELEERLARSGSTRPGTSPAPGRFRSTSLRKRSRACRARARSWPTAAAPTASMPTMRCGSCERAG